MSTKAHYKVFALLVLAACTPPDRAFGAKPNLLAEQGLKTQRKR